MQKIYGATDRTDCLMQTGRYKWQLIYGFGTDGDSSWNWRENFNYKPTADEMRATIIEQINARVAENILNGFKWNDMPVYLSAENQFNFKAIYDMAEKSADALPIKLKLGDDENGIAQYHEFTTIEELRDFYTKAINYIHEQLLAGWDEKENLDVESIACYELK